MFRNAESTNVNAAILMYPYLERIHDREYIRILELLNAKSFREDRKPNIYLDTYHLFVAELANCDYFLTTDAAILNQFCSHRVKAINPSGWVEELKV